MTSDVVAPWNLGALKSLHPQLTLTSSAPLPELLTLLEAGLRDASFKVKKRSGTGFVARYVDWVDVVAGGINKTTLTVEAAGPAEGGGAAVVVTGRELQSGKRGAKRAAQGLSTTVEALRVRGFEASITPWRAADRG